MGMVHLLLEGPLSYTASPFAGWNHIIRRVKWGVYAWVWVWEAITAHARHVAVEKGGVEEVVGVAVPVHVLCFG